MQCVVLATFSADEVKILNLETKNNNRRTVQTACHHNHHQQRHGKQGKVHSLARMESIPTNTVVLISHVEGSACENEYHSISWYAMQCV